MVKVNNDKLVEILKTVTNQTFISLQDHIRNIPHIDDIKEDDYFILIINIISHLNSMSILKLSNGIIDDKKKLFIDELIQTICDMTISNIKDNENNILNNSHEIH